MLDKHEINGDEIIYLAGQPETVQPRTGEMMEPRRREGPGPSWATTRTPLMTWPVG